MDEFLNSQWVVLILLSLVFLLFVILMVQRFKFNLLLKKERQDAIKRSRAVLGGQMVEQVSPYLPGFPCNPADARFIGKPIDFIGFSQKSYSKALRMFEFDTPVANVSRHTLT